MSKPTITIHIEGPAGSGKTLLARHLASYLRVMHRLNAELIDGEVIKPTLHDPLLRLNADITIIVEQK